MKRFLERLHEKRVHGDVDDMVFWTETNSGKFFVKSLYLALKVGCLSLFPFNCIWNVWVQPKISFFCVGGYVGQNLNLESYSEKRMDLGK